MVGAIASPRSTSTDRPASSGSAGESLGGVVAAPGVGLAVVGVDAADGSPAAVALDLLAAGAGAEGVADEAGPQGVAGVITGEPAGPGLVLPAMTGETAVAGGGFGPGPDPLLPRADPSRPSSIESRRLPSSGTPGRTGSRAAVEALTPTDRPTRRGHRSLAR